MTLTVEGWVRCREIAVAAQSVTCKVVYVLFLNFSETIILRSKQWTRRENKVTTRSQRTVQSYMSGSEPHSSTFDLEFFNPRCGGPAVLLFSGKSHSVADWWLTRSNNSSDEMECVSRHTRTRHLPFSQSVHLSASHTGISWIEWQ